MLNFTYSDYDIDYRAECNVDGVPGLPEGRFMPDQLLDCLEGLLPRMDAYCAAYEHAVADGSIPPLLGPRGAALPQHVHIAEPRLFWNESLELTVRALEGFDADLGQRFRHAIGQGWIEGHKAEGEGVDGRCKHSDHPGEGGDDRPATVLIYYTDTVCDMACTAHEAGHYLSVECAGQPKRPEHGRLSAARVVAEIQAYFLQQAIYEGPWQSGLPPDIVRTLQLQRHAFAVLAAYRIRSDFQEFWNERRLQIVTPAQEPRPPLRPCFLHMTPHWPALFIGPTLYRRHRDLPAQDRDAFVRKLFPLGRVPELAQLLDTLGIHDLPQLKQLFLEGADLCLTPDFVPEQAVAE